MYGCLRHAHYRYRLQLPYKSHRTYLTNRMGSISHHITPLVINSLGGGHTHAHTHTHTHTHTRTHTHTQAYRRSWTEAILRNQVHAGLWPARAWFKKLSFIIHINQTSICDSDFFVGCSKSTGMHSSINSVPPHLSAYMTAPVTDLHHLCSRLLAQSLHGADIWMAHTVD